MPAGAGGGRGRPRARRRGPRPSPPPARSRRGPCARAGRRCRPASAVEPERRGGRSVAANVGGIRVADARHDVPVEAAGRQPERARAGAAPTSRPLGIEDVEQRQRGPARSVPRPCRSTSAPAGSPRAGRSAAVRCPGRIIDRADASVIAVTAPPRPTRPPPARPAAAARARALHPARPGRGPADGAGRRRRRARADVLRRATCGCPASVGDGLAATQARRLRLPGVPRAIVIFHPLQYPLARGADRPATRTPSSGTGAGTATRSPTTRRRASASGWTTCTLAARMRAAVTIVVSDALGELAREEGGEPLLVPLAADSLPRARSRRGTVVAVSLGHLGHRTDWALLRAVAEADAGARAAADRRVARRRVRRTTRTTRRAARRPTSSGSGRRSDEEAARLILLRRRRHRPVRALGVQRHRRCPTGSSSTRGSGGARSRPTWRACARGTAR